MDRFLDVIFNEDVPQKITVFLVGEIFEENADVVLE